MKLIPKRFLSRTILMILLPLVISEVIIANAFFGNHWKKVHATMARSLASEISTMLKFIDKNESEALKDISLNAGINVSVNQKLNRPKRNDNKSMEAGLLHHELLNKIGKKTNIYIDRKKRLLFIDIPSKDSQIITFATSLYRIYSTSTEVFILWLIGSILIVSILITPFIIGHTRSIRNIAKAANRFGRGLDAPNFTPSGSKEIREAAIAMILMKERIDRYNKTRTDMLNAVSHDLKSPLSRMRLGIETDSSSKEDLLRDIDSMSEMINGYLSFVRGEMPEIEQATELPTMLTRIARDSVNKKKKIETVFPDNPAQFYARPMALARGFTNIIENASKYAKSKVCITEKDYTDKIEIMIEDDGVGIPDESKDEAMRPFVRLDKSRESKGTGLGLSIAKTIFENHGGQIFLENSKLGGLKVRIILPL